MAVGWKTLAGIVAGASIVSVGVLYSVLVRSPSSDQQTARQTVPDKQAVLESKQPKPQTAASSPAENKPPRQATQPEKNTPSEPPPLTPPSFDIVRVEPNGSSVVAGQGGHGATVELLRNGVAFARAVADVSGQWAIVPSAPLPKGNAELTLRATAPDGRVVMSKQTVTVRIPSTPGEEVVVLLNAPDEPSRVLGDSTQPSARVKPAASTPSAAPKPESSPPATDNPVAAFRASTAIRTVEADDNGRFFVTGTGEPGATVRIYLNDTPVATVTVADDGTFGMKVEKGMLPGEYKVRADDVLPKSGQVLSRAEVPFIMVDRAPASEPPLVIAAEPVNKETAALPKEDAKQPPAGAVTQEIIPLQPATTEKHAEAEISAPPVATTPAKTTPSPPPSVAVIPEVKTMTIMKGDNLWRISRRMYGQGVRYTWIYEANSNQIRDPDMIYPGQIFVMPEKKTP